LWWTLRGHDGILSGASSAHPRRRGSTQGKVSVASPALVPFIRAGGNAARGRTLRRRAPAGIPPWRRGASDRGVARFSAGKRGACAWPSAMRNVTCSSPRRSSTFLSLPAQERLGQGDGGVGAMFGIRRPATFRCWQGRRPRPWMRNPAWPCRGEGGSQRSCFQGFLARGYRLARLLSRSWAGRGDPIHAPLDMLKICQAVHPAGGHPGRSSLGRVSFTVPQRLVKLRLPSERRSRPGTLAGPVGGARPLQEAFGATLVVTASRGLALVALDRGGTDRGF